MRYFYVDTENVKSYDFMDNWEITEDDVIVFFLSENSKSIKFKDLGRFINNNAQMIFEEVFSGEKNAMDFQMVSYITDAICSNTEIKHHYVVSDDNDFYTAIKYINNKYTHAKVFILKPEFDKALLKLVNKVNDLNELNLKIRNSYGQENCMKIYPTYRQVFRDIEEEKSKQHLIEEEITNIYQTCDNLRSFRNALRSKYGNAYGNEKYLEYKNKYILNIDENI